MLLAAGTIGELSWVRQRSWHVLTQLIDFIVDLSPDNNNYMLHTNQTKSTDIVQSVKHAVTLTQKLLAFVCNVSEEKSLLVKNERSSADSLFRKGNA